MCRLLGKDMERFMRKPQESRKLLFCNKNKRDDRGSAIVIVIIAMALIGILASTILWASYLNYRIKVNDLRVKNSFYSAETVVEQILAGVKKEVVSASVNEAYQEVVSNWDALGTDDNRQSYFITAYISAVEERLNVQSTGIGTTYDKDILKRYVDANLWEGAAGNVPTRDGYIVNEAWDNAEPLFKAANEVNGYGSMSIKNICVEFYDSDGLLSIINTDIAIDVPSLRFTQAGTIDRLYPYVLVGDTGITMDDSMTVGINGSIYGGVDDHNKGGIQIGKNSHVTVENANYIISGGDIVIGNDSNFQSLLKQDAELIVRDVSSGGVGYQTKIYAKGLALNGSHLDISGKMFIANDLILSGSGSNVSLSGQYFGYGNTNSVKDSKTDTDDEGNTSTVNLNPATSSSAIVINGKDSTVDLTGLNTLQLAGRAYVSLSDDDDEDDGKPHVLMGESISVKSNQIAYLVPAECIGTLDGKTIIGQNPMSYETWSKMMTDISGYAAEGQDFRVVDANREVVKLGGEKLISFGVGDITASELSGVIDPGDVVKTVTGLNASAEANGVRFLYMPQKQQVYLYLVMDAKSAANYFAAYYNVNSNKASLDSYFNQYASGGIKLKDNVQGYTVVGNSMVSVTAAGDGDNIQTSPEGDNLVRLLASVTPSEGDDDEDEDGEDSQPADPDAYTEVSDNVTNVDQAKSEEELAELIENAGQNYKNLTKNLLEDDGGLEDNVFENLIRLETPADSESVIGLKDYLDSYAPTSGKVTFTAADGLKAVLVDSAKQGGKFNVADDKLRLVIAIGDVEVTRDFKGLIIASGTITVANNVTCKQDGEGVYAVLQAQSEIEGDPNVPAQILSNGSGMIKNGYDESDVDENGNLNINYSEIVRYENWIKK